MLWALNSSAPVLSSQLAAHLEDERLHYEKCLLKVFAKNLLNDEEPTVRQPIHDAVSAQMKSSIASAAAMAATMGTAETLFLATVAGHVDDDHADGITERVTISIDVAPPSKA